MREYFKFETLASATGIAVLCHIVGPLFLLVFIIATLGVGASLAFVGVIWWPVIGVFIWGLGKKERYAARAALPVFSLMFAIPLLALMIWAHIETTRAQIYFDSQDHADRISRNSVGMILRIEINLRPCRLNVRPYHQCQQWDRKHQGKNWKCRPSRISFFLAKSPDKNTNNRPPDDADKRKTCADTKRRNDEYE